MTLILEPGDKASAVIKKASAKVRQQVESEVQRIMADVEDSD